MTLIQILSPELNLFKGSDYLTSLESLQTWFTVGGVKTDFVHLLKRLSHLFFLNGVGLLSL